MPRMYKRISQRTQWPQEELSKAINAAKNKTVRVLTACRTFGMPTRTLRRRIIENSALKVS
jgi:16S rRNA U516 pseudouridylate synthase RsuA-like enzyme